MTDSGLNTTKGMAPDSNGNYDVKLWHGYSVFFSTIFFFHFLNYVVQRCGTPKSVRSDVDPWRWRNLFISWFHAAIVGTWDILWYVYRSCINFELVNASFISKTTEAKFVPLVSLTYASFYFSWQLVHLKYQK